MEATDYLGWLSRVAHELDTRRAVGEALPNLTTAPATLLYYTRIYLKEFVFSKLIGFQI